VRRGSCEIRRRTRSFAVEGRSSSAASGLDEDGNAKILEAGLHGAEERQIGFAAIGRLFTQCLIGIEAGMAAHYAGHQDLGEKGLGRSK
jgi:hypothetical protein